MQAKTITEFIFGLWVVMPLARLLFPNRCCRCGEETKERFAFRGAASTSVLGVVKMFGGVGTTVDVPVPFCTTCQKKRRRRKILGAVAGLFIGIALIVTVLLALPEFTSSVVEAGAQPFAIVVVLFVALALFAYAGWIRLGGSEPIRLRRYSVKDKTVEVWFERSDYRKDVERLRNDV